MCLLGFIANSCKTLINEMLLEPYNKATCIAMLNTLFPPVTQATKQPTPQLTPRVLKSQRDGFFRYISAVDTTGKHVLDQVRMQGARPGEDNGWPLVHEALCQYLELTADIIDQCTGVDGPESLDQGKDGKTRKADSGISFGSSEMPARSLHSNSSSVDIGNKPLPTSPSQNSNVKPSGSALERLARELRRIGDSHKIKGLSKMRSNSALSLRSENPSMVDMNEESTMNIDDRKRKRFR